MYCSQLDLGWMRRVQQILGRKPQRNLHAIYVLHPTFGMKAAIFALQLFVDNLVWKKVVYVDRLLQLFRYVHREQLLTIPDFVFQKFKRGYFCVVHGLLSTSSHDHLISS
ncbi:rho GTPase-activating protein gacY-like isoform X3 [Prunus avium]|uniref:Rho GTPase-activating protein gacY-like isoform X3 n=1 Tax=Prunus avium TaxID=42229 RepID=A0A6P5SMK7_PRUAV|nr:rho GTPase-activating protein gacY-like isoform X3 [Prunus avium]